MKKEIKIGLFVILAFIAVFFTVEFLKGKNIFSSNRNYYVCLDRSDGLFPTTYVTIKGFRAGKISEIKYNKNKKDYTILISVSKDFEIPEDSHIEVYDSDIMGTKAIDLILGKSENIATSGDTLRGNFKENFLSSLISEISPLKENINTLIDNINRLIGSANSIMNENSKEEINEILRDITGSVRDFNSIVSTIKNKTPQIENVLDNMDSISAAINASSTHFASTIANIDSISHDIKNSHLTTAIDSLKSLIIKIQDPNGTLGSLMTTDSLYNTIISLSNNLNILVRHIDENPKKYLKISVF